jgi:UDP-glucose 4-epimerase
MKKQALVTGGAGFIGTNLIKLLLQNDFDVTSIDNYFTGFESNHIEGATYIKQDLLTISDFSEYGVFDIVFHLAAIARIQPSFNLPVEYFENNAVATMKIAKFCVDTNTPLVYAGSSSHHSGKFKNPYTFSKDIGEEIIDLFQQHYNLNASVARFYNVYGPNHLKGGGYCTVIGKWEHAIETKHPIVIYGDGTKRRDFTHVNDIVSALLLIFKKNAWGHIFELGTGKNYSIQEIANMFEYSYIVYDDDKPGEAIDTLCNSTLAKTVLNWECKFNIKDYILNYIGSYE